MLRACWSVALAVVVVGTVGAIGATAKAPDALAQEDPSAGRDLWRQDCAVCHGERGLGSRRGPPLAGVGPAGVDFMVRTGRMPIDDPDDPVVRSETHYSDAEAAALVEYAATFVDGPAVPEVDLAGADLSRGGELYRLNCASCHQSTGQGGVLTAGTDVPPIGAADAVEIVEAMRAGPNEMPVYTAEQLDDEQAADIAAYLEEIDGPEDPGGWSLGHWGPVPEGAAAFVFGLVPAVLVARWLGQRSRPAAQEDELR